MQDTPNSHFKATLYKPTVVVYYIVQIQLLVKCYLVPAKIYWINSGTPSLINCIGCWNIFHWQCRVFLPLSFLSLTVYATSNLNSDVTKYQSARTIKTGILICVTRFAL